MDAPDLKHPDFYLNRELSLLQFHSRVLAQATDESLPLLERLRFLCISSTNLDEFFEIRVAGLKQQVALGISRKGPDGLTPQEQLGLVNKCAHALVDDGLLLLHEFCWDRLDERTGRWLHHHLQRVGHHDDEDATSFLGRWRKEHRELATYRQLRGRLDRWFRQLEITWVPYLAEEYLHGDPVARREEATRLRAGTIQPVAFHYAGRRLPG
jgi:hypothetical protein